MGFVPMELGLPHSATGDSDHGDALTLPPATDTVPRSQPRQLADRSADSNSLDVAYGTDELEIHVP